MTLDAKGIDTHPEDIILWKAKAGRAETFDKSTLNVNVVRQRLLSKDHNIMCCVIKQKTSLVSPYLGQRQVA